MTGSDEETRLLSVAESISGRKSVDWRDLEEHSGPLDLPILTELKALEGVARSHEAAPQTWGPFTIIGEIARGAFGTVYIATEPGLGTLALKVIRPRNPDVAFDATRAFREARLLAKINHPNVVRVFRADRIENEVGLAMELIQGRTLDDLVQSQSPVSAREAAIIGLDLCQALAAVHKSGTVHGDIKAHNVMRADGGRIVLMDFGAAKNLAVPLSGGHDFVGTPLYMAPEVFDGHPRTKVTDIYSLGVLLYYLVSGEYPVSGSTHSEVKEAHTRTGDRRPLRDVRPDLPDAFVRVVERASASMPADRYQSAGELEMALASALQLPLPAPAPAPAMPWRSLLIAASVLLVVGLGGSAWYRAAPGRESAVTTLRARDGAASTGGIAAPGSYRINAALYRKQNGTDVPIVDRTRLAPDDALSLEVTVSDPVYLYVVNEDEHGESFLLFPLEGLTANPLPAGRHRLPGAIDGAEVSWQVTSKGGKEHFLVMASPTPPAPMFQKMFASLPRATFTRPAAKLTAANLGVFRGIGGLTVSADTASAQLHEDSVFGTALTGKEEAVRGVWIRQATVENPD